MWIPDSKELYDNFYSNKKEIENSLGFNVDWDRMDEKKGSRICTYIEGLSFSKPDNYTELSNQIINILIKFRLAFKPYIKNNA
jgi:hypothetical protein